ncbi:MAG: hypothetical protein AB9842_11600 [Bacteroidales bacterium]
MSEWLVKGLFTRQQNLPVQSGPGLWKRFLRFFTGYSIPSMSPSAKRRKTTMVNKKTILQKQNQVIRLSITTLKEYSNELSGLSVEGRMIRYDLREDPADFVGPTLQICTGVMKWADIEEMDVPKFGLADDIVRSLYIEISGHLKLNFFPVRFN